MRYCWALVLMLVATVLLPVLLVAGVVVGIWTAARAWWGFVGHCCSVVGDMFSDPSVDPASALQDCHFR